jgi:hypothetical protein
LRAYIFTDGSFKVTGEQSRVMHDLPVSLSLVMSCITGVIDTGEVHSDIKLIKHRTYQIQNLSDI